MKVRGLQPSKEPLTAFFCFPTRPSLPLTHHPHHPSFSSTSVIHLSLPSPLSSSLSHHSTTLSSVSSTRPSKLPPPHHHHCHHHYTYAQATVVCHYHHHNHYICHISLASQSPHHCNHHYLHHHYKYASLFCQHHHCHHHHLFQTSNTYHDIKPPPSSPPPHALPSSPHTTPTSPPPPPHFATPHSTAHTTPPPPSLHTHPLTPHATSPSPPSPPITTLPWSLWLMLVAAMMAVTPAMACNTDARHCGDLHFVRGPNIHSLAWVVEVSEGCQIAQVLTDFTQTTEKERQGTEAEARPGHYCGRDIPHQIILLKQLSPFKNTYLVAHPFFRLFSKYQRRARQQHRRVKHSTFNVPRNATPTAPTLLDRAAMFLRVERCIELYLRSHPCLAYARQEVLRPRKKRRSLEFSDPLYREQWHLSNPMPGQYDINVGSVWESGITGRGVTVCVIDDGLEWRHPDLRNNYSPAGSYDLNSDDPDPSPVKNGERNEHGTRCAGEIAAVANSVCGVGVAFHANISGIRVLGERMTDSMEAAAFVQGLAVNDIYSCSWGPDDDGRTVDGPHHLAKQALLHGVTYGRGGYGAVYVVASGNGGRNKDNCNFDGYANSVYTVTIGAVDSHGQMPYYAEECAAMLAVTPSSGTKGRDIVTTDWREISQSGCTKHHSGTSAAAPLAAAVIALALEVQPCLSWRDVQHLIALTSRKIDATNPDWSSNGAGLHHSHQHGFGLMDAAAMVSSAAVWESVPFSTTYSTRLMVENVPIPAERMQGVTVHHEVDHATLRSYALTTLEFVQVQVSVEHQYRGSLKIVLVCPSGTRSTLAAPRDTDNSTKGLTDWALGTVRCWGEDPAGVYQVTITQTRHQHLSGRLLSWRLVLHGSSMTLQEFQDRRRLVERARRGEVIHVNRSTLCHPPELRFKPFHPLPEKWLKVLAVTSLFLLVMVAFNTLEYIFCYNDEKERFYRRLRDVAAGRALQHRRTTGSLAARRAPPVDMVAYGSVAGGMDSDGSGPRSLQSSATYEILPLMGEGRRDMALVSPSPSCDADVSSFGGDEDDSDEDNFSSHCTSDTVLPKDTDATDFTNDEFFSEADEERHGSSGGDGSCGPLLGGRVKQQEDKEDEEEVEVYVRDSISEDGVMGRRGMMDIDFWTAR